MTVTFYNCGRHGTTLSRGQVCPECVAFLDAAPDVAGMTPQERSEELHGWLDGPLTAPFDRLHERAEALVGRPVWTHEFASSVVDNLYAEIESGNHPENLNAHANDVAEKIFVFPDTETKGEA